MLDEELHQLVLPLIEKTINSVQTVVTNVSASVLQPTHVYTGVSNSEQGEWVSSLESSDRNRAASFLTNLSVQYCCHFVNIPHVPLLNVSLLFILIMHHNIYVV